MVAATEAAFALVWNLAMLLRNRFYGGEVVHRGQIHPGKQQPILDRELFNAVPDKLTAGTNARLLKLHAPPSILTAAFLTSWQPHDAGPHKQGARYRYYVSHISPQERGSGKAKTRINAAEVETTILAALRNHLTAHSQELPHVTDRELIAMQVERIVVKSQPVEISVGEGHFLSIQRIPNETTATRAVVHAPESRQPMSDQSRDLLLTAIAKARCWIDNVAEGHVASFADIAKREGKVERHIRLLAPLAFVQPRVISRIVDGTSPSVTVTSFAKNVDYSWSCQAYNLRLF